MSANQRKHRVLKSQFEISRGRSISPIYTFRNYPISESSVQQSRKESAKENAKKSFKFIKNNPIQSIVFSIMFLASVYQVSVSA